MADDISIEEGAIADALSMDEEEDCARAPVASRAARAVPAVSRRIMRSLQIGIPTCGSLALTSLVGRRSLVRSGRRALELQEEFGGENKQRGRADDDGRIERREHDPGEDAGDRATLRGAAASDAMPAGSG